MSIRTHIDVDLPTVSYVALTEPGNPFEGITARFYTMAGLDDAIDALLDARRELVLHHVELARKYL